MTIKPTRRSATASDTIKKLVEVWRPFSLLTLNMTAQFPMIATIGNKIASRPKKFNWMGFLVSKLCGRRMKEALGENRQKRTTYVINIFQEFFY